ncbi:MAG: glycosyltransferase family 4 protein [Paracoccaceae bacterium]
MQSAPRVAFYAPMKAPDHPTPSGDRKIARLTLTALERAGFAPFVASELRTLDIMGNAVAQTAIWAAAEAEITRIVPALAAAPPDLWFTYHSYYKAPDLIGPTVSQELGIPYVVSEPSVSAKRRDGAWSAFAKASEQAIGAADLLFWTTERDRPALEEAGYSSKMQHLPAFLDPGPAPRSAKAGNPLRLLTVAMMRPGDKIESYRRIAAALIHLTVDWQLEIIGDGPGRPEVEDLFNGLTGPVHFLGAMDDASAIRAHMDASDLFLWPGVNEGVGMVWLEAQAAGLPVIAEDHPAAQALVQNRLGAPSDAARLADLIVETAAGLPARAASARAHVEQHHSLNSASIALRDAMSELLG